MRNGRQSRSRMKKLTISIAIIIVFVVGIFYAMMQ